MPQNVHLLDILSDIVYTTYEDKGKMNASEILQKFEEYKAEGWTYIPEPTTWSGGTWMHEELGFVNQGGGSFDDIIQAVEGMARFKEAFARIQ